MNLPRVRYNQQHDTFNLISGLVYKEGELLKADQICNQYNYLSSVRTMARIKNINSRYQITEEQYNQAAIHGISLETLGSRH